MKITSQVPGPVFEPSDRERRERSASAKPAAEGPAPSGEGPRVGSAPEAAALLGRTLAFLRDAGAPSSDLVFSRVDGGRVADLLGDSVPA